MLILLSWSLWVSKSYHIENKAVTNQEFTTADILAQPAIPLHIEQKPAPQAPLNYSTGQLEISFIESQAAIQDVTFKAYNNYKFCLQNGLLIQDNSLTFKTENTTDTTITFTHADQDKRIDKKFIFSNSSYNIWLELIVQNLSTTGLKLNLPLILGTLDLSSRNIQARYQDVTVATKDKTLHLSAGKLAEIPYTKFASLRDRYFCEIVEPQPDDYITKVRKINAQTAEVALTSPELLLMPGQQMVKKFHIYLGPQDLRLMDKINPAWSAIVYYGTFDLISQVLLQLLEFLQGLVHNWGWAIIIFSFIVYVVLYPLTLKQMRSMKEMQVLQPQIAELRNTYKDNQQRFNKEVMELYRKHKVNPFGGCLPIILQMPIFIALWQAFQRSILLKNSTFLWIKDLSSPDNLLTLPSSWPVKELNILPILTALLMFMQQKMYAPAASGSSAEQQKLMSTLMPLIFGFAFYNMPSGWVLYFLVNSVLMLVNQIRINKIK